MGETKNKKLAAYRSRRDFRSSGEPRGSADAGSGKHPIFVIQEHDATSHHFDFRLEADGVLKSWAVPKGPSTDPGEKRLAIPTEDHPLDYADFEGVIPEDEYGGGTVIVWDAGAYGNLKTDEDGDPVTLTRCYEKGTIEIDLRGKKLKGGYALIRTKRKRRGKHAWLLVKMRDDEADARRNPVSTEPESVLSGKTIAEMARQESGKDGDDG